jgi:hypothetical protein
VDLPLYAPGIHTVTEPELKIRTVDPFPGSLRRPLLFSGFTEWLAELRATGATGKCWLDGSFLTDKAEPSDIDLVVFPTFAALPSPAVQTRLQELFNQAAAKAKYRLDVYLVPPDNPNLVQMTSYWRGWFGFCRDGATAKGIAEVIL